MTLPAAYLAILLYVAALAIVLKWATNRAALLDDHDIRGLSDAEIEELRVLHERDA